jgi:pyroglutamyl-peptidase
MTKDKIRLLVTGFGPFPGAPYNPTEPLVDRLVRLRRPAFEGIERIGHIFPVTYHAVDLQLPALLARHEPDVLLMFGLARRTPWCRVETRARNAITQLWPDADHATILSRTIDPTAPRRASSVPTRAICCKRQKPPACPCAPRSTPGHTFAII